MDPALESLTRAEVNGERLAYREAGEGDPVVLVHGSLSDVRSWDSLIDEVGDGCRAIAYSRRYSPPNAPIADGADDPMGTHVDDLLALLPAIDAEPAHLVGHSWGGFVSLLAAIERPEAVRSLLLIEPPVLTLWVSQPPRPGEILRLLATSPGDGIAFLRFGLGTVMPATRAYESGDLEAGTERFARGALGSDAYDRLPAERREQALENAATMRAQLLGAGFPPLSEAEVESLRLPVTLLVGERSTPVFVRLSERLAELLPQAELRRVPDVGHGMPEQRPEAVNEQLRAHLQRVV